MQLVKNPDNPRGRKYDICVYDPTADTKPTMLELSLYEADTYWVQIQGYRRRKAVEIMEGICKGVDARKGYLFPAHDGGVMVAQYERG